jgi:hypothetical protein
MTETEICGFCKYTIHKEERPDLFRFAPSHSSYQRLRRFTYSSSNAVFVSRFHIRRYGNVTKGFASIAFMTHAIFV